MRGDDQDVLELWEFPRSFDLAAMDEIARDPQSPPDVRAQLVSSRGDVITIQLASGRLTSHAELLVFVRGRGAFEILRREVWPGGRELVTLRALDGGA